MSSTPSDSWTDAMTGACLFAIMPHGLGGVRLRAGSGPVRDRWLELLTSLLDQSQPVRRIHPNIGDAELLGGLDLAATLESGRTVSSRGVLGSIDSGVLVLAMAERCSGQLAARIAAALDAGTTSVTRDVMSSSLPAAFGLVALDEGEADEVPPAALLERLSLDLDLTMISIGQLRACSFGKDDVARARQSIASTRISAEIIEAIAATALSLGVMPLRLSLLTCAMARASAALFGREEVDPADAALAVRLVLAPRASVAPNQPSEPQPKEDQAAPQEAKQNEQSEPNQQLGNESASEDNDQVSDSPEDTSSLSEQLLEAAVASIPQHLLDRLLGGASARTNLSKGRSGSQSVSTNHGRPLASVQRSVKGNARLDLIGTLRAAAPWQRIRRQERARHNLAASVQRVQVRTQDLRARRYVSRSRTTTIFAVDASGSAALARLAETKGAVELMLAQCYVRRDQVAVISFRDQGATLALPPTRSLVRAKRSLAGMVGGGGTPLAAALDSLAVLADSVRRRGDTPVLVVLSDGRANIASDLSRNRELAHRDAMRAALNLQQMAIKSLFIDTSMRPAPQAESIARQMGAQYLALPFADARGLSQAAMAVVR